VVEQLHAFVFTSATSSQASATPRPRAILLDIPSQQFYALMWPDNNVTDPVTETSLKTIIKDFKNDKLPFVHLSF